MTLDAKSLTALASLFARADIIWHLATASEHREQIELFHIQIIAETLVPAGCELRSLGEQRRDFLAAHIAGHAMSEHLNCDDGVMTDEMEAFWNSVANRILHLTGTRWDELFREAEKHRKRADKARLH